MDNTYWNSNGKHQALYNELFKALVPQEGEAESIDGETIRTLSSVYYDIYNNGGGNMSVGMALHKDYAFYCAMLLKHGFKTVKYQRLRKLIQLHSDPELDEHNEPVTPDLTEELEAEMFQLLEESADLLISKVGATVELAQKSKQS